MLHPETTSPCLNTRSVSKQSCAKSKTKCWLSDPFVYYFPVELGVPGIPLGGEGLPRKGGPLPEYCGQIRNERHFLMHQMDHFEWCSQSYRSKNDWRIRLQRYQALLQHGGWCQSLHDHLYRFVLFHLARTLLLGRAKDRRLPGLVFQDPSSACGRQHGNNLQQLSKSPVVDWASNSAVAFTSFHRFQPFLLASRSLPDKDPKAKGTHHPHDGASSTPKLSFILRIPRMKLVKLWTWRVTSLGHHTRSIAFTGLAQVVGKPWLSAWLASPTKHENATCLRTKWSCRQPGRNKIQDGNISGAQNPFPNPNSDLKVQLPQSSRQLLPIVMVELRQSWKLPGLCICWCESKDHAILRFWWRCGTQGSLRCAGPGKAIESRTRSQIKYRTDMEPGNTENEKSSCLLNPSTVWSVWLPWSTCLVVSWSLLKRSAHPLLCKILRGTWAKLLICHLLDLPPVGEGCHSW